MDRFVQRGRKRRSGQGELRSSRRDVDRQRGSTFYVTWRYWSTTDTTSDWRQPEHSRSFRSRGRSGSRDGALRFVGVHGSGSGIVESRCGRRCVGSHGWGNLDLRRPKTYPDRFRTTVSSQWARLSRCSGSPPGVRDRVPQGPISTGVPGSTIGASWAISEFGRRTHPWLAYVPITQGWSVPCIPICPGPPSKL